MAADGGLRLAWQPAPTGEYILLDERRIRGWWRVECEGKVRQQSPVGFGVAEISGRGGAKPPPAGATGGGPLTVGDEVRMAEEAGRSSSRSLLQAAGLPAEPPPVLRWSGRIPGGDGTGAALVAPAAGAGPLVLHVGASSDALVALARPDDATPDDTETLTASRADWALASSAVSTSAELMAVRVPARSGGHAVLTDQLLVVPPADAVQVVAVFPDQPGSQRASSTVIDGAAVLQLPVGLQVTVQALDRRPGPGVSPAA
ncbi:hypothetical protein JNW88_19670 [Micromonospora sp. ATA32]|nr:hypothetical protein [Micromonospora sp. ATA32]